MANMDIFTFVDNNTYLFAEFFREVSSSLLSNKNNINWNYVTFQGHSNAPRGFNCVSKIKKKNHSSSNHANALEEALKYVNSEYIILADADIAILYPDWDQKVINILNDGIDFFGFMWDKGHRRKYHNCPSVDFMCFKRKIIEEVTLNFSVVSNGKYLGVKFAKIGTQKEADIFGKKIGEAVKCDTGWALPFIINTKGYTTKMTECFSGKDTTKLKLQFKNKDQKRCCLKKPHKMIEQHLDGELFGTHFKHCYRYDFKAEIATAWQDRIHVYLKNRFGIILADPFPSNSRY